MIQIFNNLRGKKLHNAIWLEGYFQMIHQVVIIKRPIVTNDAPDEPQRTNTPITDQTRLKYSEVLTATDPKSRIEKSPATKDSTESPSAPPLNPYAKSNKPIQLMTSQRSQNTTQTPHKHR
jgi:hypothetical protein